MHDRGHAALHALLGVPEAPALQNPGRFGALGVALRLLPCEMLTEQGNDLKHVIGDIVHDEYGANCRKPRQRSPVRREGRIFGRKEESQSPSKICTFQKL